MSEWKQVSRNFVLDVDGVVISYLPPHSNVDSWMESDDPEIGETALLHDGEYYILNGDHRKEYEELIGKGYGECYNYFLSKPDLRSSWSN